MPIYISNLKIEETERGGGAKEKLAEDENRPLKILYVKMKRFSTSFLKLI